MCRASLAPKREAVNCGKELQVADHAWFWRAELKISGQGDPPSAFRGTDLDPEGAEAGNLFFIV